MVEPTELKWLDVQTGSGETLSYAPPSGKERVVTLDIPSQLLPYIVSSDGVRAPMTLTLKGDLGDYVEFGNPINIEMVDVGNTVAGIKPSYFWNEDLPNRGGFTILKRVSMRVPTLKFRVCGINYSLNWKKFSTERRIASGATGQEWGYAREGYPTYGEASLYDVDDGRGNNPTIVKLKWENELDTPEYGGLCVKCPDGYVKNEVDACVLSAESQTVGNMWLYGSIGVGALVLALNAMKGRKKS